MRHRYNTYAYICFVLFPGVFGITTYYLDDHCDGAINVGLNSQIYLHLTRNYQYQNNFRCQVSLKTNAEHQLMVYFRSLNIQKFCQYDWLELDDSALRSDAYITGGKICGDIVPTGVYNTSDRYMTVYFRSDGSVQGSGFQMIITPYHTENCSSSEYQCNNQRCISDSLQCTGYNPCGDHSDCGNETLHLHTPPPVSTSGHFGLETKYLEHKCGEYIFVDKNQQIRLRLTPSVTYRRNITCSVLLEAPFGSHLMAYFQDLDMELSEGCSFDWLELDDGLSRSDSHLAGGRICGHTAPTGVFHTSGRYLTVYFHSDFSEQGSGFDIVLTSYHTGNCGLGEYNCGNGKCISEELQWSNFNPCGIVSTTSALTPLTPLTTILPDGPIIYLDENCGRTVTVGRDDQMQLYLTRRYWYQNNLKCQVTLEASEGNQLMVYFRSLDIEKTGSCGYDWLEIDDGASRYASYINGEKLCGDTPPAAVYNTTGRYMTVYFKSDGSEQGSGFRTVITSYHTGNCSSTEYQCNNQRCISNRLPCTGYNPCGDHSDCASTTIQPRASSPCSTYDNFGIQTKYLEDYCGSSIYVEKNHQIRLRLTRSTTYRSNITCDLTLETLFGNHLMTYFEYLNTELSNGCSFDWVELDDGASRSSSYMAGGKICGYNAPTGVFHTSGRHLTVYFQSDSSGQGYGFDVVITSYHTGLCLDDENRCSNGKCISRELECNLNPCGIVSTPSPLTTVSPEVHIEYLDRHCGSIINIRDYDQIHLQLTSSYNYEPNMRCKVVVQTNPADYMMIEFLHLNTENNCNNDWVELDDGDSRSDLYIAGGKQCGNTPPSGVYKTHGRSLTVYFESDGSVQGTGFNLLIKPSVTKFMDRLCSKTVNIGDLGQIRLKLSRINYQPNLRCQLNLETSYGDQMMFYFRDLSTENICTNDWVEIDDGDSRSDPYLAGGKHCGRTTPRGVYKSSGRFMTLYFQSDSSVQFRGFDMIITSFHTGLCSSWRSEYVCSNGRCINDSLTCNGYNSCGDYSDCITRHCDFGEYECRNGRCIPNYQKCNGQNPCGDFSDCTTTTAWTPWTVTDSSASFSFDTSSLSGAAIAGISMSCIVGLIIVITGIAICCNKRKTPQPQVRREPLVSTVYSPAVTTHGYSNSVALDYTAPPPSYETVISNLATTGQAAVHKPNTG